MANQATREELATEQAQKLLSPLSMDFVSHALWGGSAFGRSTRKAFLSAAGISLLPMEDRRWCERLMRGWRSIL